MSGDYCPNCGFDECVCSELPVTDVDSVLPRASRYYRYPILEESIDSDLAAVL